MRTTSGTMAFVILMIYFETSGAEKCQVIKELSCGEADCYCEGEDKGSTCFRVDDVTCINGRCTDNSCECHPCWSGSGCQEPANADPPKFAQSLYEVVIPSNQITTIDVAKAGDADLERCRKSFPKEACPCGNIHYSITRGNEHALFFIDPQRGDIEFLPENHFLRDDTELVVSARNEDFAEAAETTIRVRFEGSRGRGAGVGSLQAENELDVAGAGRKLLSLDEDAHHRAKRSAPLDASGTPLNVSFLLSKTNGDESQTTVKIGDKIDFNLTMWMPDISTDMKLEIYTESNNSAIISVCSPIVSHVGRNFDGLTAAGIIPQKYAQAGDWKHDRIVIDFGTLTNSGTYSDEQDHQIVIQFSAVVENNPLFAAGETYWVSTGASYMDKTKVWVGQSSFTATADSFNSTTPPEFNLTGPCEVMKGAVGSWRLEMTFYAGATDVILDVYAPLNNTNIMSICRVGVLNGGDGMGCYGEDAGILTYPYINSTDSTTEGNKSIATFDLGSVVNTLYRDENRAPNTAGSTIVLDISVMMLNTSDVQVGADYWLGVSVEVDESAIWAAQVSVSPSEPDFENMTEVPTMTLSAMHSDVEVGASTMFLLNMTLPPSTSATYDLEVSLPLNGTAVMDACAVNVRHVGYNFPCYNKEINPIYESENNDGIHDYIKVKLGDITNTGARSDTMSNTITVEICATMLEHALYANGDKAYVTVGVRYSRRMIWVGQTHVVVRSAGNQPQPSEKVDFTMINIMNNRNKNDMYEGGQTAFYLDAFIPPGTIYPSVNLQVNAPVLDGEPVFDICRVRIVHVGRHHPCWDKMFRNHSSIELLSSRGDEVMDLAVMNLTLVSNGGLGTYWWNKNDSSIRTEIVLRARNHPSVVNGSSYDTQFVVDYGGTQLWSKTVSLKYNLVDPELSSTDDQPEYTLRRISNSSTVKTGGAIQLQMDIALTPQTITRYTVDAFAANDTTLSVCRLVVLSKGDNIPCLSADAKTQYTQFDNGTRQMADIDLYNVANIGQYARNTTNLVNNTLTMDIVMLIHQNSSDGLTNGDQLFMAATVNQGSARTWIGSYAITADTDPYDTSTMAVPVFELRKNTSETIVTKGASALFIVDIYVPPATQGSYDLEVYAPFNETDIGKMSICDIRVISAGWNVPCLNDTWLHRSTVTKDQNFTRSEAKLHLGTIVNTGQTGDIKTDDNKVSVEISVLLPDNSTAEQGDELFVAVSAKINSDKLWVAQKSFTVTTSLIPSESVPAPVVTRGEPTDLVWLRIGGIVRMSIDVRLPEMTAYLMVAFTPQSTGSGALHRTVNNVHYSYRGENIACACDLDWPLNTTYTSSYGTSHYTGIDTHTKFITNVGTTHRYQWGEYKQNDDLLRISFDIQVTHEPENVNGSLSDVNVQVKTTDGFEKNLAFQTGVIDNVAKVPELQLFLFTDEFDDRSYLELNEDDTVRIKVHANHTWDSSAYANDVTINLMLPDHLVYQSIDKYVHQNPGVAYDPFSNVLNLTYSKMLFTDNETIWVNFTIDPNRLIPKGARKISIVIVGDIHYQTNIKTELESLEFDAYIKECLKPLGLENGDIDDCQIKASSSYQDFSASQVRLNSKGSWANAHRGNPFLHNEFIQINLGNKTRVTGLSIQGHNGSANLPDAAVQSFKLQYSLEGVMFFNYKIDDALSAQIFNVTLNETLDNATVYIELGETPIEARSIRLIPISNTADSYITGMRLELHGCVLTADKYLSEVCPTDSRFEPYPRGYLVDVLDDVLYVCMVPNTEETMPKCSYTSDQGTSWRVIDDVVNIDFLRKDTRTLYGLGDNLKSRKRSTDGGENWCTISEHEYSLALSQISEVLHVKQLPFEQWTGLSATGLYSQYGFNISDTVKYSANVAGLHVWTSTTNSWSLVGYWGTDIWV